MVIIRLSRYGRKKKPFYNIVVADSRKFRNAKFLEKIGYFNPFLKNNSKLNNIFINLNKLNLWINNGAKITKIVKHLIKKFKLLNKNE